MYVFLTTHPSISLLLTAHHPRREVGDETDALHASQLPYQAGWQDIKDLFRHAGSVVRADINVGIDGRAKGSGTVVFETAKDAQNAISAYFSSSLPHWPIDMVLMRTARYVQFV